MSFAKNTCIFRAIAFAVLTAFFATNTAFMPVAYSQELYLPPVGTILTTTGYFAPPIIKGIKVDPQNPLAFEFLIDPGQAKLSYGQKQIEYKHLIEYFLASITTSEKDMWVNLSPYEHNRIISENFGATEMGRDMLAQDYILKQLTASLIYPESNLGKEFWARIYARVKKEFGSTDVPVNTFNKVWILPDSATIFEKGNVAIIVNSHLKVMLEEDYMALSHNPNVTVQKDATHGIGSQIIREIILPELEREVNEGKDFAQLRQMYNSMVLASWFKQRLKQHALRKVYANRNKDAGIELKNPNDDERVYQQYIKAFKKGVFNYIREDSDPMSGQTIPRKYFSGGFTAEDMSMLANTQGAVLRTTGRFDLGSLERGTLEDASIYLRPEYEGLETSANGQELRESDVQLFVNNNGNNIIELTEALGNFTAPANTQADIQADSEKVLKILTGLVKSTPKKNLPKIIQLIKILAKANKGLGNWNTDDFDSETSLISDLADLYLSAGKSVQAAGMNVMFDLQYNAQDKTAEQNQIFAEALGEKLIKMASVSNVNKAKVLIEISKTTHTIATHSKVLKASDVEEFVNSKGLNRRTELTQVLGNFHSPSDIRSAINLLSEVESKILFGQRPEQIPEEEFNQQKKDKLSYIIELVKILAKTNGGLGNWGARDILPDSVVIVELASLYFNAGKTLRSVSTNVMMDLQYNTKGFSKERNNAFAKGLSYELRLTATGTAPERAKAFNEIAATLEIIGGLTENQIDSIKRSVATRVQARPEIFPADLPNPLQPFQELLGLPANRNGHTNGNGNGNGYGHENGNGNGQIGLPATRIVFSPLQPQSPAAPNHRIVPKKEIPFKLPAKPPIAPSANQKSLQELRDEAGQEVDRAGEKLQARQRGVDNINNKMAKEFGGSVFNTWDHLANELFLEQRTINALKLSDPYFKLKYEKSSDKIQRIKEAMGAIRTPGLREMEGQRTRTVNLREEALRELDEANQKYDEINKLFLSNGKMTEELARENNLPLVSANSPLRWREVILPWIKYKLDTVGNYLLFGTIGATAVVAGSLLVAAHFHPVQFAPQDIINFTVPNLAIPVPAVTYNDKSPDSLKSLPPKQKGDKAIITKETKEVGGIDFDPKYLQLNIQGDGINVPMPSGFEWLLRKPIQGFVPQILEIKSGIGSSLSFFKNLTSSQ